MSGNGTDRAEDRLTLRGRLSDLSQLPQWIEALASRHGIPAEIQYAMNLCLEEVAANIIRHGYGGDGERPIRMRFTKSELGRFVFVVEDEAPHFNPLDEPELPPLSPGEEIRIGGQGLRLLHRFADVLEYEPTATGNRLKVGFEPRAEP